MDARDSRPDDAAAASHSSGGRIADSDGRRGDRGAADRGYDRRDSYRRSRSPGYDRYRRDDRRSYDDRYGRGGGGGYRNDSGGGYRGDRDRGYDRRGGYDRDNRRGSRSPSGGREKSRTDDPELSREEQELLEITRDARTVFISQFVVRATESDIQDYFEQAGKVSHVSLIKDKITGKSKGMGYVEMADLDSVPKALLLNGQKFCMKHKACTCSGFPIAITPSGAEKNYAAMAEAAGGTALSINAERRVYICNLPSSVTEGDLKAIGEQVGVVEKATVIHDADGRPKGNAFITYSSLDAASRACEILHNLDIAGRQIKVGKLNAMGEVIAHNGERFTLDTAGSKSLSAQARAAVVLQLAGVTSQAAAQLGSSLTAAASGNPSVMAMPMLGGGGAGAKAPTPCLLLKNLFDPTKETQKDWDVRVKQAVLAECSKFGSVVHIYVVRDSMGNVHVMFSSIPEAIAAMNGLSGRVLETTGTGSTISVDTTALPDYVSRFPEVASKI